MQKYDEDVERYVEDLQHLLREDRARYEQEHSLTPSDDQPGCSSNMISEEDHKEKPEVKIYFIQYGQFITIM